MTPQRVLSYEYIAGLFDGEGCISLVRRKRGHRADYSLRVKMEMTDEATVRAVHKAVGRGSVFSRKCRPNRLRSWRWDLAAQDALAFLVDIRPHLRTKADIADVAIEFQSSLDPRRGNRAVTDEEAEFRAGLWQRARTINRSELYVTA